jgi:hypothetical protein
MRCRVFWENPETGELELYATKSLDMSKAETHEGGREGWDADIAREVAALHHVAGVPGVVGFREMITDADGGVHLILECGPSLLW